MRIAQKFRFQARTEGIRCLLAFNVFLVAHSSGGNWELLEYCSHLNHAIQSLEENGAAPATRQTVEAVLEAVVRIVKRDGIKAVTTNRVTEVAGVSIGSVYQYFTDKRAIFHALRQRHMEEIDRLVNATLVEHAIPRWTN